MIFSASECMYMSIFGLSFVAWMFYLISKAFTVFGTCPTAWVACHIRHIMIINSTGLVDPQK